MIINSIFEANSTTLHREAGVLHFELALPDANPHLSLLANCLARVPGIEKMAVGRKYLLYPHVSGVYTGG